MKRLLLSLVTLPLLLATSAQAGDWEDGYRAYQQHDYKSAMTMWRRVAATGDSAAQSILGAMHAFGQGVPQSYPEAIKWYRLAAAQGDVKAQEKLGFMYANGQGVSTDHLRAYMWSYIAAGAGSAAAVQTRETEGKKLSLQEFAQAQKMARNCQLREFKGCE